MNIILQTFLAAVGSFVAITMIFVLVFTWCKRKHGFQSTSCPLMSQSTELSSIVVGESAVFDPSLREVSMAELADATNNFDKKLIVGDGSFGLVYKAKLCNGVTVALKKLSPDAFQGIREFRAEMETLGKVRHRNIVKILGYCVSNLEHVLIYEFVEKGSLDQWLQDISEGEEGCPLSWDIRVRIVKGVANGLAFMHGLETPIIHRDIKASNVLLDEEFEPHIADFGFARRIDGAHSHVSTQAAGTMGYMPPEYLAGVMAATRKADVYSFGVLMFEVATGKRPNWSVREDGHDIWMLEWSKMQIAECKHMDVIDPVIPREELKDREVGDFLAIANLCTSEKPIDRPVMQEVVEMLNCLALSESFAESK